MSLLWLTFCNIFVGIFIAFIFLGEPTRRMGHRSGRAHVPELLGRRYQSTFIQVFAGLVIALFMPLYGAAVLIGGTEFISTAFQMDYNAALLMFAVIVAAYVFYGGLKGVMYTDALQGVIMFVGMGVLMVYTYAKVGGVSTGHQALTDLKDLAPPTLTAIGHRGWTAMPEFGFGNTQVQSLVDHRLDHCDGRRHRRAGATPTGGAVHDREEQTRVEPRRWHWRRVHPRDDRRGLYDRRALQRVLRPTRPALPGPRPESGQRREEPCAAASHEGRRRAASGSTPSRKPPRTARRSPTTFKPSSPMAPANGCRWRRKPTASASSRKASSCRPCWTRRSRICRKRSARTRSLKDGAFRWCTPRACPTRSSRRSSRRPCRNGLGLCFC